MCRHCGPKTKEEREKLRNEARFLDSQFKTLGQYYVAASEGKIRHHEGDVRSQEAGRIARSVIRTLVDDWV